MKRIMKRCLVYEFYVDAKLPWVQLFLRDLWWYETVILFLLPALLIKTLFGSIFSVKRKNFRSKSVDFLKRGNEEIIFKSELVIWFRTQQGTLSLDMYSRHRTANMTHISWFYEKNDVYESNKLNDERVLFFHRKTTKFFISWSQSEKIIFASWYDPKRFQWCNAKANDFALYV